MRRGRLLLLALGAACAPAPPPAAPVARTSCAADFDSAVALVSRDYAGFADAAGRRAASLAALTDSLRAETAPAPAEPACTRLILRWLDSFDDPHLTVSGRGTAAAQRTGALPARRAGRTFSLRFPDDSTAVLRLPTFELTRRADIDSLVIANRDRLLATPYLLIDVRGNGGGWSGSYASLLPLLYTGPIRLRGIEIWASEGNVAVMRRDLASTGVPAEVAAEIRAVLPRMQAAIGRFVPLQGAREMRLDTVHPLPRAVAVLIDRGCASACEQFVLEARQSGKVTVIGAENTRGALDYLNVRSDRLPSGLRTLRVPISRLQGLPADPVNAAGLAPDVLVPAAEPDLVGYARRRLRGSP